jgi:hypothetical protein
MMMRSPQATLDQVETVSSYVVFPLQLNTLKISIMVLHIYTLAYLLAYLLMYSLSLTHSLTHSLYSLTHSHSFTHSLPPWLCSPLKNLSLLYDRCPFFQLASISSSPNVNYFLRWGCSPHAQPQTWRISGYLTSCPHPSACLTWVTLPGV